MQEINWALVFSHTCNKSTVIQLPFIRQVEEKEAMDEFKEFFHSFTRKTELFCYCFDLAAQFSLVLHPDWTKFS